MSEISGRDERNRPPSVPRRMPTSIPPRSTSGGVAKTPAGPQPRRSSVRPRTSGQQPARSQPGSSRTRGSQPAPQRPDHARLRAKRRRHPVRRVLLALLIILLLLAGGFWLWVESKINHVPALSGAADTPGQTYLIVGSDAREGSWDDGTEGARTDTIIVLHKPETGPTAMISLPRDSYVEIPGHGSNKINAAFAYGGAPLLVETVENLTGLTVDHYLEVGFLGVTNVVDALGGVELCLDRDVDDWRSKLQWSAGCHVVDGPTALAFSRMRYADPIGDIGRTQRQQQLVSVVAADASSRDTVLNPSKLLRVIDAGLASLRVSDGTGAFDLVGVALTFKSAQGDQAVLGTPPLVSIGHHVDGVGSTVLLDADASAEFWRSIADGSYAPGTTVGGFG